MGRGTVLQNVAEDFLGTVAFFYINSCGFANFNCILPRLPPHLEGDSINVMFEIKKNMKLHPLLQKDLEVASLIKSILELL